MHTFLFPETGFVSRPWSIRRSTDGRRRGGIPVRRSISGVFFLLLIPMIWISQIQPARAQHVRVHVSPDSVTVGQRFFLSLVAEHNLIVESTFPSESTSDSLIFGDLEVIRRLEVDSVFVGGTRIDSLTYEVTTFALDTAFVPPIPVLFTSAVDTFIAASIPIYIPVISLVPPDAENIQPLAPIVAFERVLWPWFLLAATLILVIVMVVRYYVRRRREEEVQLDTSELPPPTISPFDEAMERLRPLEKVDLYARPAVKPYYVELSDTLRYYLSRRVDVPAMENTTRELLTDIKKRSVLSDHEVRNIREILELSDFVKFADLQPDPERGRGALSEAHDTLRSIERTLYRPPVLIDSPPDISSNGSPSPGDRYDRSE